MAPAPRSLRWPRALRRSRSPAGIPGCSGTGCRSRWPSQPAINGRTFRTMVAGTGSPSPLRHRITFARTEPVALTGKDHLDRYCSVVEFTDFEAVERWALTRMPVKSIRLVNLFACKRQPGSVTHRNNKHRVAAQRVKNAISPEEQLPDVRLGDVVLRSETQPFRVCFENPQPPLERAASAGRIQRSPGKNVRKRLGNVAFRAAGNFKTISHADDPGRAGNHPPDACARRQCPPLPRESPPKRPDTRPRSRRPSFPDTPGST